MWLGRRYTLDELAKYAAENTQRNSCKILIIDDDPLEYEEDLRTHDYYYRHVKDIESIDDVSEYQIVVCDIGGVGRKFKSQYEGAHIIGEINIKYPNKIKIAYTGKEFDIRYNKYFEMCDDKLHKDDDFETWIEVLDHSVAKVLNPIDQWKRIRGRLISSNVSLYDVFLLEQDYIKSLLKNDTKILQKSKGLENLNTDLRQVVLSIISNGVFHLMLGLL